MTWTGSARLEFESMLNQAMLQQPPHILPPTLDA